FDRGLGHALASSGRSGGRFFSGQFVRLLLVRRLLGQSQRAQSRGFSGRGRTFFLAKLLRQGIVLRALREIFLGTLLRGTLGFWVFHSGSLAVADEWLVRWAA